MKRQTVLTRRALIVVLCSVLLAACSDDSSYNFEAWDEFREQQFQATQPVQALFSPADGVVPFPSNILPFDAETGTLALPVADPDDPSDPTNSLNRLDGFSTVAPITTATSKALNPESLVVGQSIRVFEVETVQRAAVSSVVRELAPQEIAAAPTDTGLALLPTVPLKPASGYMVVLTSDIQGADGTSLAPSLSHRLVTGEVELTGGAAPLEPWRQATRSMLTNAAGQGVDTEKVVLIWTFTTQSSREVLQAVKEVATARPLVVAPTGLSTSDVSGGALPGFADVYIGTLELPYYLAEPDAPAEPAEDATPEELLQAAALAAGTAFNSVWQTPDGADVTPTNALPEVRSTQTVPVLMSVPNASSPSGASPPEGGWPVVIFQHAISADRSSMLALADAMAAAGQVVVAIDLPLHGVAPDNPLSAALSADVSPYPNDTERLFGIDLVQNDEAAGNPPGVDGEVDPSGTHFINLRNLANTRDNVRQAVADLFTLSASLAAVVSPEGVIPPPLNAASQQFVGMSLGGIVGGTFLSFADDTVQSATLNVPGGGIAYLLAGSDTYGPRIEAGLAAQGIEPGSDDFQRYLLAAQTVIDSADPINHASALRDRGTPVLMQMVRGDAVIPNQVPPLSGTEPLARILGLQQTNGSQNGSGLVVFAVGDHGTLLRPEPVDAADPDALTPEEQQQQALNLKATVEMQTQVVGWAQSKGSLLVISEDDDTENPVIEAPAP